MVMAGIRCGYVVADEEAVRIMLKAREPFLVNRIAQAGAATALDNVELFRETSCNNKEGYRLDFN